MQKQQAKAKTSVARTKRNRQSKSTTRTGKRNVTITRALLAKIYQTTNPEGQRALEAAYPNLVGSNERYRLGGVVTLKVGRYEYTFLISLAKNRKGSKWITLTSTTDGSRWNNSVCVRNVKAITRLEMMNLVGSQNIGGLSKLADKISFPE